jgi:hypothetical protein
MIISVCFFHMCNLHYPFNKVIESGRKLPFSEFDKLHREIGEGEVLVALYLYKPESLSTHRTITCCSTIRTESAMDDYLRSLKTEKSHVHYYACRDVDGYMQTYSGPPKKRFEEIRDMMRPPSVKNADIILMPAPTSVAA